MSSKHGTVALWVTMVLLFLAFLWTLNLTAFKLAARDRAEAEKENTLRELKGAIANIRTLEGLLPICLSSKKIQDQKGNWQPFEYFVRAHSEAKVTHKICPDCSKAISA